MHSGRFVEKHCLQELLALTEAQLGRPRRRTECIEARLDEAEGQQRIIEADIAELAARGKCSARRERLVRQREGKQEEIDVLRARQEELAAENAANSSPGRIVLRPDGAFGNADDVTWLYEQGYSVVGRVHAHRQRPAQGIGTKLRGATTSY